MKRKTSSLLVSFTFILAVIAFVYFASSRPPRDETIRVTFDFGQPQKNRIAVLFFHNLGGNSQEEYLSDGLTEDIVTRLAEIRGLSVKSMNDVRRFKNRPVTIREAGKALEVDAILEGSVRKSGTTLLVSAQLIDVATGRHIWAERYERKIALQDIFGLQNELAAKIAGAAHLNLTRATRQTLTRRPTISAEAYEFYLKGKYHHLQMTIEGNWMAAEMFQKALELDPDFALAHALLGDVYAHHYHLVEPADPFWLDQAKGEIEKALALDTALPEAHKALGHCYDHSGESQKAAEEYQKALTVKPHYVEARIALGETYLALRRFEEALRELKTALENHPEFPYIYYAIGRVYSVKGDFTLAVDWIRKGVDKGFRSLEWMKKDPLLEPIRKNRGFQGLMKDLKKKGVED